MHVVVVHEVGTQTAWTQGLAAIEDSGLVDYTRGRVFAMEAQIAI